VISSYNYGRFLDEAIESALGQTYSPSEVVVVDDGSTDESIEVIDGFGDRIVAVLKPNGGQGSALNAGFARSRGEVVVLLDADDVLLPSALERAVEALRDGGAVKVHWPMWVVDERRRRTGELVEPQPLEGDFREVVAREGPMTETTLESAPTSGNAWTRSFLDRILPMPERLYRIMADDYLYGLAPAFGPIVAVPEPQSLYRQHGDNAMGRLSFEERLRHGVRDHEQQSRLLRELYAERGVEADPAAWKANGWWPRIERSIRELEAIVPVDASFVLVDQDDWGTDRLVAGRRRIPFVERGGEYWGLPESEGAAIDELERQRVAGARFAAFAWSAFWMLADYPAFGEHVRSYPCVLENERLRAFALAR
jgi:glycosyltransferase involved in cell wall biosynthesis